MTCRSAELELSRQTGGNDVISSRKERQIELRYEHRKSKTVYNRIQIFERKQRRRESTCCMILKVLRRGWRRGGGAWWWWLVVRLSLRVKIGKQRTWMTEKEQVRS
jgi:hypothetical protein